MSGSITIPKGSYCRGCEYDLTGLSAPGVCPECGREFKELASDERIELDWRCLRCGYSLLGLPRNQKCSECGMPAGISLDPTLFRFLPTEYRKRVKSGSLCVGLGVLGMVFLPMFLGLLVGVLFAATTGATPSGSTRTLVLVCFVGAFALYVHGWFRILSRPPVAMGLTDRQERIRVVARSSLAVFVVIVALSLILGLSVVVANTNPVAVDSVLGAIQIVALLSFGVFFLFSVLALKPLFARARTVGKRPGALVVFTLWLGIASILGYVLGGMALAMSAMYGGTGGALAGLMLIAGLASLGSIVLFFCYLGTTEGLRNSLRRVEREIAAANRTKLRPDHGQTGETPGPHSPNNQPA